MSGPKNLPEPLGDLPPAQRGGRVPTPRGAASAPVHAARPLEFSDLPGRDHWWALLDPAVRRRIPEKVGATVEWWAFRHAVETGRPYAVVLGTDGLAVTTPIVNPGTGRLAHKLNVRHFEPGTVRHAAVTQRPSGRAPGAGPATPTGRIATLDLGADLSGFLGNLPSEAQARMQTPFLSGDYIEDSNYFYMRTTDRRLNVWCYLAGKRTVTFAAGHRDAPEGAAPHTAFWQLTCWVAEVTPP